MLKLLRRKSFRKSKEFKPASAASKSSLNGSSGSVYSSRPHRFSRRKTSEAGSTASGVNQQLQHPNSASSQNSLSGHRYSSIPIASVPEPEILQYSRPPENLTSPVRESLGPTYRGLHYNMAAVEETAARMRAGHVMATPRALPPTPKRPSSRVPPTAQALPTNKASQETSVPRASVRMSLRSSGQSAKVRKWPPVFFF